MKALPIGYKSHQMLFLLWMLLFLLIIDTRHILSIQANVITTYNNSDLCYLADGGSSATFTVNEATSINSVIGTLQVIGNVSTSASDKNGEIELSLAPNHSHHSRGVESGEVPIRIESHSKQLILIRKLDKEGPEGEQGIIVGIRCRKISPSNDPSIIIPVRIIVTDANDHSPEFIASPYSVNVSEVSVPGSTLVPVSRIRAVDGDQQGPFSTVEYYIEPGPFSHLVRFQSRLGGELILTGPLDYETLPKFWVTIRAQDQGEPPLSTTTTLTVIVLDADDQNPRFADDKYSAMMPDVQRENQPLTIKPKAIRAIDPDTEINSPIEYTFNSDSREYSFFSIDPKYAAIKLRKPLPATFGLPITLVIRATQTDNRDRYALTTLTIFNRRDASREMELRFHKANYNVSVPENVPLGQVLITVSVSGRDENGEPTMSTNSMASSSNRGGQSLSTTSHGGVGKLTYQILDDEEGNFDIRPNGEIIVRKMLDYEKRLWYSFRVMVSDGKQSDVTRVNVTLTNVNDHDPQFSQSHYTFFVSESKLQSRSVIGEIKATDKDVGDTLDFTIKGPFAKMFNIDRHGKLRVRGLKSLNVTQCHLIVVASDTGSPPRSSSVPVTVQFALGVVKNSLGRALADGGVGGSVDGLLLDVASSEIDLIGHRSSSSGSSGIVSISSLFNVTGSSAIVLVIVLGVLLATLFIIIITLTVHVFRNRKIVPSSGLSSSSTDSCASSTDSCGGNNPRGGGGGGGSSNMYTDSLSNRTVGGGRSGGTLGGGRKSFSISSLAKKSNNNKMNGGLSWEGRSLFGIPSKVPGLGLHGVENPIFNLPSSTLPNNLTSRYYSHSSNNGSGGGSGGTASPAPPNSSSNKSDPDSAIVSDASSAETTCNGSSSHHHSHLLLHSHQQQQLRASPNGSASSSPDDNMMVDLTVKHRNHHNNNNNNNNNNNQLFPNQRNNNHHHHHSHMNSGDENCSHSSGGSLSPPPPPSITCTGTMGGGTASRISVIKWPQGSIPRRVKKLTWEDERRDHTRTELDPDVSVAPYRRTYLHPFSNTEAI
ncbi:uncharacterized protein LOC141850999 isoform X2 [Brevipalpus obovatus]|uniref:uncharacterized protein LOC141850999 isoform X2 n=1 Tax=Brevipalpus obovatus TaxID=246614 RepID=UPI003D9DCCD3